MRFQPNLRSHGLKLGTGARNNEEQCSSRKIGRPWTRTKPRGESHWQPNMIHGICRSDGYRKLGRAHGQKPGSKARGNEAQCGYRNIGRSHLLSRSCEHFGRLWAQFCPLFGAQLLPFQPAFNWFRTSPVVRILASSDGLLVHTLFIFTPFRSHFR